LGLGCLVIELLKATPPAEQGPDGGAEADERGIRKLIKVYEVFLVSSAMSKRKINFVCDFFCKIFSFVLDIAVAHDCKKRL
jgi:hypothetical protein